MVDFYKMTIGANSIFTSETVSEIWVQIDIWQILKKNAYKYYSTATRDWAFVLTFCGM